MMMNTIASRVLIGLLGVALPGCGGGSSGRATETPPQTESAKADVILGDPAGWSDANMKSAEFYQAGNYAEALRVLETFAKEHPTFDRVELMLGDNLVTMPSNGDKTVERERRERAIAHYRHGLELARDEDSRDWGEKALLRLYSRVELDRPADAEPVARAYVKRRPSDPYGYTELASALRRQQKHDEATRILRQANAHIDGSQRKYYAEALVTHADQSPSLPPAEQRQLLAEARPVVDSLLEANAKDMTGLGIKARMLAVEARLEPNPAKRKALEAESTRLDAASNAALLEALGSR